jgi:hypothetical protein
VGVVVMGVYEACTVSSSATWSPALKSAQTLDHGDGTLVAVHSVSMRRAGYRIAGLAFALAVSAACSDDAPPGADAGDDDGGGTIDAGDGGGGTAGLRFEWRPDPVPPGEVEDDLTIDEVHLHLRDLRAVGDAAPGDARTSRAALDLDWEEGAAPPALRFDTAPPGLYSQFEFRLDGGDGEDEAYSIEGMVYLEDAWVPYEIEDGLPLSVSIPLDVDLAVGEVEVVDIRIRLDAAIEGVDWANATLDDGTLVLDEEQLAEVRDILAAGFEAEERGAEGPSPE